MKGWHATVLMVLAALVLAGCGGRKKEPEAPIMVYQDGAMLPSPAERLKLITPLLNPAPGLKPADVDFLYLDRVLKTGSGKVRERRFFAALYLDKAAVASVKARLKPAAKPAWQPPIGNAPWWPTPDQFGDLQFFSTEGVLAKPGGFAACYSDGDTLFLYGDQPP